MDGRSQDLRKNRRTNWRKAIQRHKSVPTEIGLRTPHNLAWGSLVGRANNDRLWRVIIQLNPYGIAPLLNPRPGYKAL